MGYKATVSTANGGPLNFRAGTSTGSDLLAQIPNNTVIHVKDIGNSSWVKAFNNQKLGYVMRQHLNEHPNSVSYGIEAFERYGERNFTVGYSSVGVLRFHQDIHYFAFLSGSTYTDERRQAVREYQEAKGLAVDGIAGIAIKEAAYRDYLG